MKPLTCKCGGTVKTRLSRKYKETLYTYHKEYFKHAKCECGKRACVQVTFTGDYEHFVDEPTQDELERADKELAKRWRYTK